MKIFKILFSFSAFLIFSLSFTLSAVADQEVDEVESVEVAAELSDDEDSEDDDKHGDGGDEDEDNDEDDDNNDCDHDDDGSAGSDSLGDDKNAWMTHSDT